MDTALHPLAAYRNAAMDEPNRYLGEIIARERARLARFVRRHVPEASEAEDILQDVFISFVEQYRLPQPIEQVGAWLVRVARNRIIDRFRKKRDESLPAAGNGSQETGDDGDDDYWLAQVLPSDAGDPEALYVRARLLDAIAQALDELPAHQREVFVAHELDGVSFKAMAAQRGVGVNTLLGWKRQAVLQLRARLRAFYDDESL